MSSSKWRELFAVLRLPELDVQQVVFKFVGKARETAMALPWLDAPHNYVDSLRLGPFPLVSIEWMEIRAEAVFLRSNNVPARRCAQDIDAIRTAVMATGKLFPLEDTGGGLRITGHVPRSK
jgi:hypothetical protein